VSDDPKPECEHRHIVTYLTDDEQPAGLWGCRFCSAKFVPLGPEMDAAKRAQDEAVAQAVAAARKKALHDAAQAAQPDDSYVDEWFKAKADAVCRIRALADKPAGTERGKGV
jgi:hypothetical protein